MAQGEKMTPELTTLCYLEKDGCLLMLHRVSKKNDINKDKWIGVGGHFEDGESPDECLLREVYEETGLRLTSWRFRGVVTFDSGASEPGAPSDCFEYMHLFTADGWERDEEACGGAEFAPCSEGTLEWVAKERVTELTLWPGDRIFLRLLAEDAPAFLLKLVYDGRGGLVRAVLDGEELPV